MNLNEMWEKEPDAYQDLADDNSRPQIEHLRKTRLTLKQIGKLRLMSDLRDAETQEKRAKLRKMYMPPPAQ